MKAFWVMYKKSCRAIKILKKDGSKKSPIKKSATKLFLSVKSK